jgi:hypothetical protein
VAFNQKAASIGGECGKKDKPKAFIIPQTVEQARSEHDKDILQLV